MIKATLFSLLALALLAGCTSVNVRKPEAADFGRFHRIFVVQPFNENHHIDELFVDELKRAGREASSGPMTMMPENTDAVLTYNARWSGDFRIYLIDLSVQLHTAHTNKVLAQARYYQPIIIPKPPEAPVHELVKRLFPK